MTYRAAIDCDFNSEERAAIATVREQSKHVRELQAGDAPAADTLPLHIPASYWLDLKDYDPVATALGLDMPMLVLHGARDYRSEEHTSELQSLMRISYAVFCLKKKNIQ